MDSSYFTQLLYMESQAFNYIKVRGEMTLFIQLVVIYSIIFLRQRKGWGKMVLEICQTQSWTTVCVRVVWLTRTQYLWNPENLSFL